MSNIIIHTVKNRQTGTVIEIVQIDKPKDGYPWSAQCKDHGSQVKTNTRRMAHAEGRTPTKWCRTCKQAAAKKTTPAPAKKAPAKKTAAKKTANVTTRMSVKKTAAKKAPAKKS